MAKVAIFDTLEIRIETLRVHSVWGLFWISIHFFDPLIWFWLDLKNSSSIHKRENFAESMRPHIVTSAKLVAQHDDKSSEVYKYEIFLGILNK